MTEYTIFIVVCAVAVAVSAAAPFLNTLFRLPAGAGESDGGSGTLGDESSEALPPLSVIVVACDNAVELRSNMPFILGQTYPAGYEVIVAVEKSDDDTEAVIKGIADRYDNFYATYVPRSSRYMSRRKLAVTLGVKAAKSEWIVMTDASCAPRSDRWLRTMASNCADGVNIVMGYSGYSSETRCGYRFERLRREIYLLREAQRGTAYRAEGNNIMFRKSEFMEGKGYEGNLKYTRGEYDFLVNKYARKGRTAVELRRTAWVDECAPTKKEWISKRLCCIETRKRLIRSLRHRLLHAADVAAVVLNVVAIAAAAVAAALSRTWILAAAAAFALVLAVVLRSVIGGRAMRAFGMGIGAWRTVLLEAGMAWRNWLYSIRYHRTDKADFICHKV